MSANPSVVRSILAVRKAIATSGEKGEQHGLYVTISKLFLDSELIVGNCESLGAVLALVPDIEAFRGKGSQSAASEFSRRVAWLVISLKDRLPQSKTTPEYFPQEDELRVIARDTDLLECFELLSNHTFARTQGPPVRSHHAGALRVSAWEALGNITEILRRPEHLAHALKVAADHRASIRERTAAVAFLPEYWSGGDADEATVSLLDDLAQNSPDRDFLVSVMQARIELGLDDGFGALCAVDDWDDAQEEE